MGQQPNSDRPSDSDRGTDDVRRAWLAARLLADVRARAVRSRAIGVLQASTGCDHGQAQAYLGSAPGGGQRAAAQVIGILEAQAEHGTDPDAFWDGFDNL